MSTAHSNSNLAVIGNYQLAALIDRLVGIISSALRLSRIREEAL